MNCDQIHETLADYLGGELDGPKRSAFEEHLASCGACRGEVEALSETLRTLNRLEAPPVRVAPPARASARRRPLRYAAVLVIGLCVGWWARSLAPSAASSVPVTMNSPARPGGLHGAWIDAALATSPADAEPFARNAVRLIKAFAGAS